ncbi:MAG: GerMN domain-containing protein [Nitrospinota bacterium]|nr:GerMN domain-containing protein [Nitrospinota bacterium]
MKFSRSTLSLLICVSLLQGFALSQDVLPLPHHDSSRRGYYIYLENEGRLVPVTIKMPWEEFDEEKIKSVLESLIAGEHEYTRTVPKNTKVKRIFIDATLIVYIDFSGEIVKEHPGGVWTETLTVASICRTVFSNFEVRSVKILVEGKEIETIAGHIDLKRPISRETVSTWLKEIPE